jgi:ABC-type multidrug transport system fused ATPase/permease subunit
VVQQSPVLFDDTVKNNVRYGNLKATDEEVFDACKAACIHEQILGFTDGTVSYILSDLLILHS